MPTKITKSDLNQAYQLVIEDLFRALKSISDGDKIRLGKLGTFHKKQAKIKSALDGKTYLYYRLTFKPSAVLKKALDE